MSKLASRLIGLSAILAALGLCILDSAVCSGKTTLTHNGEKAEIVREAPHGMPHIKADSKDAAFFAQGYAHAQDRLYQMDKQRKMTQGRLSEWFGARTLAMDKFCLSVGYTTTSTASWETAGVLKEEHKRSLQAYADGVNEYIKKGALPPEYQTLGVTEVEPWQPIHSIALLKWLNFLTTHNWNVEAIRRVVEKFGGGDLEGLIDEMFPFSAKHQWKSTTTLSEKEMGELGLLHPDGKSLWERYEAAEHVADTINARNMNYETFMGTPPAKLLPNELGGWNDNGGIYASNSWVISGKHTASGKPILAADPHLPTGLPSIWTMQELQFPLTKDGKKEDVYQIGSSMAGLPAIYMGRTQDISWGFTAARTDTADLILEQFQEDSVSFGDDKYSALHKDHTIKVKDGEDVMFKVRYTQRGPVITTKEIQNSGMDIQGAKIPTHEEAEIYSFMWSGHQLGDTYFEFQDQLMGSKNIPEFKTNVKSAIKKWNSVSVNMLMADNSGNIGYMLGSSIPIRNNSAPFRGVIAMKEQGTNYDWVGFRDFDLLPFHINSEKGYYMNANNQIYPDSALWDVGATMGNTPRAIRLEEILEEKISSGHKFTPQDMIDIQNDMIDVYGRELSPHIYKLVDRVLGDSSLRHNLAERQGMMYMLNLLNDYKGDMSADQIPATVYSFWHYFFHASLFKYWTEDDSAQKQLKNSVGGKPFWNRQTRTAITDNYSFQTFYFNLIKELSENPDSTKYDKMCLNGFEHFKYKENHEKLVAKGGKICQYNAAWAILEAKDALFKHVSSDSRTWQWGNVHSNQYYNQFLTKNNKGWLKDVPSGGNGNTLSISKYPLASLEPLKGKLKASTVAGYKQVISFGASPAEDVTLMSIDTGISGDVNSPNFFDMNADHIAGKLKTMKPFGKKEGSGHDDL